RFGCIGFAALGSDGERAKALDLRRVWKLLEGLPGCLDPGDRARLAAHLGNVVIFDYTRKRTILRPSRPFHNSGNDVLACAFPLAGELSSNRVTRRDKRWLLMVLVGL